MLTLLEFKRGKFGTCGTGHLWCAPHICPMTCNKCKSCTHYIYLWVKNLSLLLTSQTKMEIESGPFITKRNEVREGSKRNSGRRVTSKMAYCVRAMHNILHASQGRFQLLCLCLQCFYDTAQLLSFCPPDHHISRVSNIPFFTYEATRIPLLSSMPDSFDINQTISTVRVLPDAYRYTCWLEHPLMCRIQHLFFICSSDKQRIRGDLWPWHELSPELLLPLQMLQLQPL